MDDHIFCIIVAIVVTGMVAFCGVTADYHKNKNELKVKAVIAGVNPIDLGISLGEAFSASDIAMLLANKKGE